MLGALAEVFGEGLTETRLEGYLAALSDVETPALRLAMVRASREGGKFFPKASELHQWAAWEWGRLWRERCRHRPTCATPMRCALERERGMRTR